TKLRSRARRRLPFNNSLLPDKHAVAYLKEQRHDGREKCCHDNKSAIDLSILRPALSPAHIPSETRLNSDVLGYHQSEEGRAKTPEQPNEDIRQGPGNGDTENKICLRGTKGARNIKIRGARVVNTRSRKHRYREPNRQSDQPDRREKR